MSKARLPIPADFLRLVTPKLAVSGKVPQAAALLPDSILCSTPWFHQIVMLEKAQDKHTRLWHMEQTPACNWNRHVLLPPSIGLILCQDRNHIVAECALRGMDKPIGISASDFTRALPASLKSVLPTVEVIETELSESVADQPLAPAALPSPAKRKTAKSPKTTTKLHQRKAAYEPICLRKEIRRLHPPAGCIG